MAPDWKNDWLNEWMNPMWPALPMNRPARRSRKEGLACWEVLVVEGAGTLTGRHWSLTQWVKHRRTLLQKKRKGNANVLSDISVAVLMLSGLNPSNGESDAKSGCDVALTFALFSSRTVTKHTSRLLAKSHVEEFFHFHIFIQNDSGIPPPPPPDLLLQLQHSPLKGSALFILTYVTSVSLWSCKIGRSVWIVSSLLKQSRRQSSQSPVRKRRKRRWGTMRRRRRRKKRKPRIDYRKTEASAKTLQ